MARGLRRLIVVAAAAAITAAITADAAATPPLSPGTTTTSFPAAHAPESRRRNRRGRDFAGRNFLRRSDRRRGDSPPSGSERNMVCGGGGGRPRHRKFFPNSLLQMRGGGGEEEDSPVPNFNGIGDHWDDVDDDVSAEELLDSIFAADDEGSLRRPQVAPKPRDRKQTTSANDRKKAKALNLTSAKSDNRGGERLGDKMVDDPKRGRIPSQSSKDSTDEKMALNSSMNRARSNEMSEGREPGGGMQINPTKRGPEEDHKIESRPTDDTKDGRKNVRAVWGIHRSEPPGPPPARAASEERRARERAKFLSDLALSLHHAHVAALQSLIKGNAAHVPPELFGQSIGRERAACEEAFRNVLEEEGREREVRHKTELLESPASRREDDGADDWDDSADSMLEPSFRHIEDPSLLSYWGLTPEAKLYGGAQYHRVLRYYHHLFLTAPLPPISDDEVALLTDGISDVHDASDLLRAVALLVRHKMERVAEEVLKDMTRRLLYVMDRQWEMVDYSMALHRPMGGSGLGRSGDKAAREAEMYRRHGSEYAAAEADIKSVLSVGFHRFAEERAAKAHAKSLEDVRSLLRYVAWDMGQARSGRGGKDRGRHEQGFVSQVKIVGGESADNEDHAGQRSENDNVGSHEGNNTDASKKARKRDKKFVMPEHSNDGMVSRGGANAGKGRRARKKSANLNRGHGRQSLRTKGGGMSSSHDDEEGELKEEMGDLIGGVMNRGAPDAEDRGPSSPVPSSRDDEVLSVLLDTVSSSLAPKSLETRARRTRAAMEGLVAYVTDRTRNDLSRIVRGKINAFFLLAFYEDLGPYLRKELDGYLVAHRPDG